MDTSRIYPNGDQSGVDGGMSAVADVEMAVHIRQLDRATLSPESQKPSQIPFHDARKARKTCPDLDLSKPDRGHPVRRLGGSLKGLLTTKCDSSERVPSHDQGMHDFEPLLSAQELAAYLDVPLRTLYAWRYRGEGPPGFRVGRHLRYRWRDVEQWMQRQLEPSFDRR